MVKTLGTNLMITFFPMYSTGYGMDMFQCMAPSTKSWIRPSAYPAGMVIFDENKHEPN